MWDLFRKIRLKREQKRLLAEKKISVIRSNIIDIKAKADAISSKKYDDSINYAKEKNSKCPKCESLDVNDRIKRQQGSISGDIDGSFRSSLFYGSGYISGNIRGNLDTNEVNKCNSCGHEWKKYSSHFISKNELINDNLRYISRCLELNYEINHCTFDPLDINEKFNSIEEKQNKLNKDLIYWSGKVKEFWFTESYTTIYIDTINFLAKEHMSEWSYNDFTKYYDEDFLISLGFKKIEL